MIQSNVINANRRASGEQWLAVAPEDGLDIGCWSAPTLISESNGIFHGGPICAGRVVVRGPVSCRALIGRRSRAPVSSPVLLVGNTRLVVLGVRVIFKLTALVLWSLQ